MQTTKKEKQIYEEPKQFFRRRRTAVELAQLGGEGHPLKWGQAVPLNKGFD